MLCPLPFAQLEDSTQRLWLEDSTQRLRPENVAESVNKAKHILPLENAKTQAVSSTCPNWMVKTQTSHDGLIQNKDLRIQKISKK